MSRRKKIAAPVMVIEGAREHNLKDISLAVPRNKFVVVTGVSGSGKSTLAFDLIFAEGQRRFLDSMNVYARQFIEQMAKPDVDLIQGIPPTVSIEQRDRGGGGKSTVATVTEIHHFLRLLYARLGTLFCPDCELPVQPRSRDAILRQLKKEAKARGDLLLLAPVIKGRKGFHTDVAAWAAEHGYPEVRADGRMHSTDKRLRLDRFREHNVEIVVGVLESRVGRRQAASTSRELVDEALKLGRGTLFALDNHRHETVHSTERSCPRCARSFAPLDPKNFSYNSAAGWCPQCRGFGELFWMPEDVDRGERADAIEETWWRWQEGSREVCPDCGGSRLNPVARAVRLIPATTSGRRADTQHAPTMVDIGRMNVAAAARFVARLKFAGREAAIARDILPEIATRLRFLDEVGLGYLELSRGVPTLSGGESQRIRLAAQLGSNLSGVLYILDEPTIGLHPRDNRQLIDVLHRLRSRGNSILVVEHDEDTMRAADYIVDLGPGAGTRGGEIVACGTLPELLRHKESITGQCLRAQQDRAYPARGERRPVQSAAGNWSRGQARKRTQHSPKKKGDSNLLEPHTRFVTLHNANEHNLKDLTVLFPLQRFVCVTGVSGSGKSTLIRDCLLPAVTAALKSRKRSRKTEAGDAPQVSGAEPLAAVYEVDQSPIGRTPRSVPATYVGFFDHIRKLFAQLPESKMRGYGPGRFSFNSPQGRCPECQGAGTVKLEMNFLPPSFVRCETCNGLRFDPETLDIQYAGKNIAEVLDMTVEEALDFFSSVPRISRALQALHDTGLDYLHLGQSSPTLSGGEAQRVKLVTHLLTGLKPTPDSTAIRRAANKRNLFLLEEPTIGLHMADVRRLVEVIQRLVDAGHTVVVIEHNLDLIAEADWVLDLGPEGGDGGGRIVVEGTPEKVARHKRSHTGRHLRGLLRST